MSAADILKMIEEVSPDDTAKLDEIDLAVEKYITGMEFERCAPGGRRISKEGWYVAEPYQYTRSRDALKAIRPEGWRVTGISQGNAVCWGCSLLPVDGKAAFDFVGKSYRWSEAPTEELAELHAIIQAIEYERTK